MVALVGRRDYVRAGNESSPTINHDREGLHYCAARSLAGPSKDDEAALPPAPIEPHTSPRCAHARPDHYLALQASWRSQEVGTCAWRAAPTPASLSSVRVGAT